MPRPKKEQVEVTEPVVGVGVASAKAIEAEERKKIDDADKLAREMQSLGVTKTRIALGSAKNPADLERERIRQAILATKRIERRIARAKKEPLSEVDRRKHFLTRRLASDTIYPSAEVRQFRFELRAIENGSWKRGMRAPKKVGAYEAIMAMSDH